MKKAEILFYLNSIQLEELFKIAFDIRKKYLGEKVWIRGLIEFSNNCVRNCLYCGLRRDNKNLLRYRMKKDEIIDTAKKIIDDGIKTIVLQSGDDFFYTDDMICEIVHKIKKYSPEVAITLSIGERSFSAYKKFYEAGTDRYLLKHETANKRLYSKIHPGQDFQTRKEILFLLKKIGFQVGAGNIVGLPEQTLEDLLDDIVFLNNLEVDMAGIGPFIPQKDTPFANFPKGDTDLTLKVLSLTRITTKYAHLPATTAIISSNEDKITILKKCFLSGADVVMINYTPIKYRKHYKIYDRRTKIKLEDIEKAVEKLNLEISFDRGDSIKK